MPATAYAETTGGTVKSWGWNTSGQLGNGMGGGWTHNHDSTTPVDVVVGPSSEEKLFGVQAIAAADNSGYALLSDGTVKAWGDNSSGQIGDGTWENDPPSENNRSAPVEVSGFTGVQAIAAGKDSAYALLSDGTVKAWGDNYHGQLGDGTTLNRSTIPVTVSGLSQVKAIAAGGHTGYALLEDGTVKAWGLNVYGQLGDGTTTSSPTPVDVVDPDHPGEKLSHVKAIATCGWSAYALLENGNVKAWGYNSYGQLGDGTTTDSSTPVTVSGLTDVQAIAAGDWSGYALLEDGTVKAWGDNRYDQLGNGSTEDHSSTPVVVSDLSGVEEIAGGTRSGYVLLNDGTVKAWGWNYNGQLGDGTTTDRSTPVAVSDLTNVKAIAAGNFMGYALVTPTDTTTTLSADQTSVTEGDSVTFTATVAPAAAGTVEFKYGDTTLGTVNVDANTGVATLTTTELPVGTNSVTAVFTPTDPTAFAPSTSDALTVTVARATATALTVDLSSVVEGDEVTFTATVEPKAAGTVEFFNGAINNDNLLGSSEVDIETGQAELLITTLPAGTNSVTALFVPDDQTAFSPSTSDVLTLTVAAKETEPSSSPDNGDTSESDGETNSGTTLPQTGDNDSLVEILSLISASLLAAGTALGIARRRSVQ